jgi:hypothetical protein
VVVANEAMDVEDVDEYSYKYLQRDHVNRRLGYEFVVSAQN